MMSLFYFIYSLIKFSAESFQFFYFNQFLDTIPGLIFHILLTMTFRYVKLSFTNLFLFDAPDYWGRNSVKFKLILFLAICKYSNFIYKNYQTKHLILACSNILINSYKFVTFLIKELYILSQKAFVTLVNIPKQVLLMHAWAQKQRTKLLLQSRAISKFKLKYYHRKLLSLLIRVINDLTAYNLKEQFKNEMGQIYKNGQTILEIYKLEIIRLFYLFITIHHFKPNFPLYGTSWKS